MKYALIGCGRISQNHIKAALLNKFEIVAICDLIPEKMDLLLSKFDLNEKDIKKYTNYKKMIEENPCIELISIATDSGVHASIALDVIRSNIHTIIEKPIAMSVEDADLIIKEAKERNIKVSVCHQNRFNLAIQKTRQALEMGRLGKLSHGSINVRWNRNKEYYEQSSWRGKWDSDGGALMNQCIHGIDLLRWMLGDEIDEVYGVTKQQFHDYIECEDVGMAVVKFKNGAIGTIEGTTNVYPQNLEETLYLFGQTGTIKIGGTATNLIEKWNVKDDTLAENDWASFSENAPNVYGNGHTSLFKDVELSIVNNREPYVSAVDGRRAVELVLAIYKASFTGKPVKLPLTSCSTSEFKGVFK